MLAQLPAPRRRPDERGPRGARLQVHRRPLPPDGAAGALDGDRRQRADRQRPRARGRGARAGEARLLLGRPSPAQPLLHALGGRARGEDRPRPEPAGEVARVRAQGAPHRREHRGRRGRGPLGARLPRRGSGGSRADRADRRHLREPAGARRSAWPRWRVRPPPRTRSRSPTTAPDPETRGGGRAPSRARSPVPVRHVWHEDRRLPEERHPQPGDRLVGGRLPGLHRRRRAGPAGLPRAPPGAGAARPLELGQPDPPRRRGDRGGDRGAGRLGPGVRPRLAAASTGRSTASAPG